MNGNLFTHRCWQTLATLPTLRSTGKHPSAMMRVFCLVSTFSCFLARRADSHVDGDRANAALAAPGTFPSFHKTASHTPALLQLNESVDAVAGVDNINEDRMWPSVDLFLDRALIKKLGLDFDQVKKGLNGHLNDVDKFALLTWLQRLKSFQKESLRSEDHEVALDQLSPRSFEVDTQVPIPVSALKISMAEAQLRAAVNTVPYSSNVLAEKMETLELTPEYAFTILRLNEPDALRHSPNAAMHWLKYAALSRQNAITMQLRTKTFDVAPDDVVAGAEMAMEILMDHVAESLFKEKTPDDVTAIIKAAEETPELMKWAKTWSKHISKP